MSQRRSAWGSRAVDSGEGVIFSRAALTRAGGWRVAAGRYVGQFTQGRREGEGTFYYSTGARYEGQWLANKKHGEGVFLFEDGTPFVGAFENDRPLGVPGEKFAPAEPGAKVYVDDLLVRRVVLRDATFRAVLIRSTAFHSNCCSLALQYFHIKCL